MGRTFQGQKLMTKYRMRVLYDDKVEVDVPFFLHLGTQLNCSLNSGRREIRMQFNPSSQKCNCHFLGYYSNGARKSCASHCRAHLQLDWSVFFFSSCRFIQRKSVGTNQLVTFAHKDHSSKNSFTGKKVVLRDIGGQILAITIL